MSSMHNKKEEFSGIYSVIGNHEFTYHKNNPFWHLVSEINSSRVKNYKKTSWKAKGANKCITICDRLEDGEVEFLFNHYGCGILTPNAEKKTIGLFHQDVVFRHVLDEVKTRNMDIFELNKETMEKKYNYIYLDTSDVLKGYNRCYFGHQHLLYGEWRDEEEDIVLNYLGSLYRTKESEISNKFLERNIPVTIVEDGKYIREDSNKFNLPSREECIDEELVEIQRTKYKSVKERKHRISVLGEVEDPIEGIKTHFNQNPFINSVIDEILENKPDSTLEFLKDMLRR
ncbi:hypothetical protein D3C81_980450 [compost metagenome]